MSNHENQTFVEHAAIFSGGKDRRQFELLCEHFTRAGFTVSHEPMENDRRKLKSVIMVFADRAERGSNAPVDSHAS